MEITIPERLRRLHRLYLAEANALAAADFADARWLNERVGHLINEELAAIDAAAVGHGCTSETLARISVALVDELRTAIRHQVGLRIAQTAFREAEKSSAILPKSQLTETRGWLRQSADGSEHEAAQAMRTVLDVFQINAEAK
jgi:hypothetical protein